MPQRHFNGWVHVPHARLLLAPVALAISAMIGCTAPGVGQPAMTEQAAEQLLDQRRMQEALLVFDQVLSLNPHDARALTHRGVLYNAIGRNDLAESDLKQAVAVGGETALSCTVLALVHQHKKGTAELLMDVSHAIALLKRPTTGTANPQAAYAVLDAADRAYALTSAFTLRAELLKEREEFTAALADADAMVDISPDMTSAYIVRASIERSLARFNAALQDDLKAESLRSDPAQTLLGLCSDFEATRQRDLALRKCNEAVAVLPGSPRGFIERAVVFMRNGEWSSAEADFESARKLGGDDTLALYGLGLARLASGDAIGRADLAQALSKDGDVASWFQIRGIRTVEASRT